MKMMGVCMAAVAALVGIALSSFSVQVAADQEPRLELGMAKYLEADFPAAAAVFGEIALDRNAPIATVGKAVTMLATCQFILGDREHAVENFTRALEIEPTLSLGDEFNPQIRDLFNEVREIVVAKIDILSDPPGANVDAGGASLGKTPLHGVVLFRKPHRLGLSLDGFAGQDVILDPGKGAIFKYRLVPLCRFPVISVSGKVLGETTNTISARAEQVVVDLEYEGCLDKEDRFYRVVLVNASTGSGLLALPLFLQKGADVMQLPIPRPLTGWVEGKYWIEILDTRGQKVARNEFVITK